MGIFNRLRDVLGQPSIDDAHFYAVVAKEIETGHMREGLWAKALAECNFDDAKARPIYMRMAVKALVQEQKQSMANAFALYDNGRYAEAIEGLSLLIEKKKSPTAAACLANIAWHGLGGELQDKNSALKLLSFAETTTDANARRFIGQVYEAIDWRKALASYGYAAQHGQTEAASAARELKKRLKSQGFLPKTFLEKWFG